MNEQFLDCAIGNGDDIILSIHPSEFPTAPAEMTYVKSVLYSEIEYLKQYGYTISPNRYADGFYHMIPT